MQIMCSQGHCVFPTLTCRKETLQQNVALTPSILELMEGGVDSLAPSFFFPLLWIKAESLQGPK